MKLGTEWFNMIRFFHQLLLHDIFRIVGILSYRVIANASGRVRAKREADLYWNQTSLEDVLYLDLSSYVLLLSL